MPTAKSSRYFPRKIDAVLTEWKDSVEHQPLLVRGARQTGKSRSVRHLGEKFDHFLEINLELRRDLLPLIEATTDIKELCVQLSAISGVPIIEGKTLLFFDEIQVSQRAIELLRYFKEEMPQLHVIAAGSLLEFVLNEMHTFGVGRIRSVFMYPFSFDEYLLANGRESLVNYKRQKGNPIQPLPEPIADMLVKYLKEYYLVGGMPEAVRAWIDNKDYSLVSRVHNDILTGYQDDFPKYAKSTDPQLLISVWRSVAFQSGNKFVKTRVQEGIDTRKVQKALNLLCLAGLSLRVEMSAANGLPLGAETNPKFEKYIFFDIGLLQTMLGLNPEAVLLSSPPDFVNKGAASEIFAGMEIVKYSSPYQRPELYYWERTGKGQAEVDYLLALEGQIVPLEIKASKSGSMQSLRLFMQTKHLDRGIRSSLENFSHYENIDVVPLYALSNLVR